MTQATIATPGKSTAHDLVLERVIDVPRELVWKCWTEPEHLKKWFTPAPWTTVECNIDLRPGGRFHTVMRSPEGQNFSSEGCYLEIVPNEKLVWTTALLPGYRPTLTPASDAPCALIFTAVLTLRTEGTGTRYTATVLHGDEESSKRHDAMGFQSGWGAALDQLVALARTM